MSDIPALAQRGQPRWRVPRTAHAPHPAQLLAGFIAVGFAISASQNGAASVILDQADDFATTVDVLGYGMVAYSLGVVVGAPLIMLGLGRMDRRPLLISMAAAFLLTTVATIAAPTIPLLIAARFLNGLPHGAFLGAASFVAAAALGPERRGKAVAYLMYGLTSAFILGVPTMQWISVQWSWRAAYVLVAVIAAIGLVLVWAFTPSVPGNPHTSVRLELATLRGRFVWTAILAPSIGFAGLGAVFSYSVPLLEDTNGLSSSAVTWVLVLWGVGLTAGAYLGGVLTTRSAVAAARWGMVVTGAALLTIGALGYIPPVTIAALVALAVSIQVFSQSAQVHLMETIHSSPSLGAAVAHASLNAGSALGSAVGAIVIAEGLGFRAPAWAALALTALALVLVVVGPGFRRAGHRS